MYLEHGAMPRGSFGNIVQKKETRFSLQLFLISLLAVYLFHLFRRLFSILFSVFLTSPQISAREGGSKATTSTLVTAVAVFQLFAFNQ